ncbi:hypothetical protein T05_4393 [Trichinella murrelli]|uniref:Uncharacterized protein n=1 Tax=Trichinella murrelli TaxID=144512 RepID=A0A0V0T6L0_9BILA|nr:hypothetical protein T05_4393 [Trichinella murrelli]
MNLVYLEVKSVWKSQLLPSLAYVQLRTKEDSKKRQRSRVERPESRRTTQEDISIQEYTRGCIEAVGKTTRIERTLRGSADF